MLPDLLDLQAAQFRNGGRGQVVGGYHQFDCWGLVMAVFDRFGVAVPDFARDCWDAGGNHAVYENERNSGRWELLAEPVAPCLVVMRTHPDAPEACNHYGVYVGGGKMLHMRDEAGVNLDAVNERPWKRFILEYRRWNGSTSR